MSPDPIYPPLLLDYAFSTDPAPIPVSTVQVTNRARVNISVAPKTPGTPVFCSKIAVAVPVDSGTPSSDSLFAQPPAGSVSTGKWSVHGETRRGSELSAGLVADQVYTEFVYANRDSASAPIDYNLVLGMFGAVSPLVGDATIRILEVSGTDASNLEMREGTFTLSKVLPEFYLKNLIATTDENPSTPITDFTNGVPIRLTWESNGTWFQLYAKGESRPIWSGTTTNYTLNKGVSRDTTFILVASMTGDPGQDTPDGGYEPIYLYEALTVTISNPVIEAATVNGPLLVNGGATLDGVAVNGTLTVEGSTWMKALTVSGLSGTTGPVSLFAAPVQLAYAETIPETNVQAKTDGLAMIRLVPPRNRDGTPAIVWASILLPPDNIELYIEGGTIGGYANHYVTSPLTVPIRKGANWVFRADHQGGNATDNWKVQILWFPMGVSADGGPTLEILPSGGQTSTTDSG